MNVAPGTVPARRFALGVWQDIKDTVTTEEQVCISWHISPEVPNESATPSKPAKFGDPATLGKSATLDEPDGGGKTSGALCGTTTLWAWPHDLATLALGHVALEHMTLEHRGGVHRGLEPVPFTPTPQHALIVRQEGPLAFHVTRGDSAPEQRAALPLPCWNGPALMAAMRAFIRADGLWDSTGCFHRAGVYDIAGEALLFRAEDIGRHNCLDRLAGWAIQKGVPLSDKALLVSARLTASLCAKALRAGFSFLVSRSAVTSAAIALAQHPPGGGVPATLVGFARADEERFTVFADSPGRIFSAWAE